VGTGFAATSGQMNVTVDEPGDDPPSIELADPDVELGRKLRKITPDPDNPLSRHQQVGSASRLRVVEVCIEKQLHGGRTYFLLAGQTIGSSKQLLHHGDTESTEIARRQASVGLSRKKAKLSRR
jgi:hypothetical protein